MYKNIIYLSLLILVFVISGAKTQSPDSFHICYFSLNNEKEFTEMEKFTKKLNKHSSHPISVKEYMTEGGSPEDSFKKMVEDNTRCDGLVISGHHTGSFGGKRAEGSLQVGFLEKISCDKQYSNWFKNIQALWLQGCRTLGTGEVVPDQEASADHHTLRVGNVLEEDHLEQSLADLDMEFSATLDQDNPLSSRYLRVFPAATVFGWTKTAPGERAGSQYSIPFHIAHIARLNSQTDQFPTSTPMDETLDQTSAQQYIESLLHLLNRKEVDNDECEGLSIEAWKRHGKVEDQSTGLGFLNPDLNAYPALAQSEDEMLKQARLLDCVLNHSTDEESILKAIDEILQDPKLIHYTFNSLLDKLKTLKHDQPDLHKKILEKLKTDSKMNQFLAQKLENPSLGILRKIDYFSFYEELYGQSDQIRSALLDQSIKILESTQSDDSYDVRDYKLTLMQSLEKHGYLTHPKGIKFLEQAMEDSDKHVRRKTMSTVGIVAQDMREAALPLVEQGMKDLDSRVRSHAIVAAVRIGEKDALPFVEQGIKDSDQLVRNEAINAAKMIGKDAIPFVEQGMNDSNVYVRIDAFKTAVIISEPDLPPSHIQSKGLLLLEQGMKDSDKHVRRKTMSAVRIVAQDMREAVLPLVEQGMKDSDKYVRIGSLGAAGIIGGEDALPFVEQGMNDSDFDIRLKAVEAASSIGPPAAPLIQSKGIPILEQGMNSNGYDSNSLRQRSLRAAVRIGEDALPVVEQGMNDSNQRVRIHSVGAALSIGEPAVPLVQSKGLLILEQGLNSDGGISETTLRIVERRAKNGEIAIPMLRQLLEKDIPSDARERLEEIMSQIN